MLRAIYNTITNEAFEGYPRRYLRGFIGFLRGLYIYYLNDRDSSRASYVSYFVVREITGEDPLAQEEA